MNKRPRIPDHIASAVSKLPKGVAHKIARTATDHTYAGQPRPFMSPSSVTRLFSEDSTPAARKQRRSRKGINVKFTADIRKLIVGFCIYQRSNFRPVSGHQMILFAKQACGVTVSNSSISNIMKEFGLASRVSTPRNSRQVDKNVWEDAVTALQEIRSYNLPPNQILVMDETGLWSNKVEPRTYNPKIQYVIVFFFKRSFFRFF